ncbi:MAG: hypothetical protein JWM98_2729 [Thermoleophilia bacterium]|nr:hypothetical protein [Thermoleophilia bacterium]
MQDPQVQVVAAQAITIGDRLRGLDHWLVASGLAIALAIVAAMTVVAALVVNSVSGATANDVPAMVQTFGCSFGFLAAGAFVGARSSHDRLLHASVMAIAGLVVMALLTVADLATGMTIASLMPGTDTQDSATVHLGFWVVTWVAVPAGAAIGASIVPRGEQDWGTQWTEPEDTEL